MQLRHLLTALALAGPLAASAAGSAAAGDAATAPRAPPEDTLRPAGPRGGIGMTTEESLEGFGKAMRLGVTTLELDMQVTKDETVVVNHDRQVSAQKCRDTAPVTPGDPMYPYVGKYLKDLTLAQVKTMDWPRASRTR